MTRCLTTVFFYCLLALGGQPTFAQIDDDEYDILDMMSAILGNGGLSTGSGSGSGAPPTSLPTGDVNLCQGYRINDKLNRPMRALARPAPGAAYTDAAFGSRIVRISDASRSNERIVKTMYNTVQAWNADESLLILYHVGDGHHLYNGRTYQYLRRLDIAPSDLEQVYWSRSSASIFYYVNRASGLSVQTATGSVRLTGDEVLSYNVRTNRYAVVKRLNNQCPNDSLTAGNDSQQLDRTDSIFGLRCGNQGLVFDRATDSVRRMPGSAVNEAPQPFPSGDLLFHRGSILAASTLRPVRTLDLGNPEHSNLGQLHNGNDAFFAVSFDANSGNRCGNGVGSLVVHDATDGSCRVIVGPATGYPYTLSGTHPSATAYRNPGWVVVSSIGYDTDGDSLLEQELYLANTDPQNQMVCRIAHHRATGRRGSVGYFAEPHPVLSPSGTRILFSSDWNNSGQVDTFVVETPAYQAGE